ncbi:hypothetical protein [Cohaesibacter haloalkalitolerans]|uniref:hypothetical protein n=1 Tax=Cohaesibacter haloalkalitolerans TaxID=1162980 RepID=UPI000E655531|nr:hypothetical protein [Cohaesibacter haloalkalitolerans]
MKGSAVAILGCAAAIYAFFAEPSLVGPVLLGMAVLGLLASWWRARPVLLLAVFSLLALAFVCLPQGLGHLLGLFGVDMRTLSTLAPNAAFTPVSFLISVLVSVASAGVVALLFVLGCRRQSGGVRLSALEASEDLGRLLCLVSRLTGLLYIPLILLPVYCLFAACRGTILPDLSLLYWRSDPSSFSSTPPDTTGWLVALLVLGSIAAAYMRDVQHRYVGLRGRMGPKGQAWVECLGGLLLLLPTSWALVALGWRQVAGRWSDWPPAASGPGVSDLILLGPVPGWLLAVTLAVAFLLLGAAAVAMILRSLVYLYGPPYLKKRAGTHIDPSLSNPEEPVDA